MKKRLKRIEKCIGEINVTLGKQSVVLDEHVRRTNLLEAEVKPVKTFADMAKGALKLIGAIGVGALIKALYGP